MREAKLEDLLSQLIHNLILENKAQHESHRELQVGQFVPRAYMCPITSFHVLTKLLIKETENHIL